MLATDWVKAGSVQPYGVCLYTLSNVVRHRSLGIPGMDLASVHLPNQYLIKLASKT